MAIVPTAAQAHARPPPQERAADHQEASSYGALVILGVLIRALAFALVTCSFAVTAWQARQEPWNLAFIFVAYASMASLLVCLRRGEQLTLASPAGERRRVQLAVWALSTVLGCAFAYRVSLLIPAALVVVIWCMTSFLVAAPRMPSMLPGPSGRQLSTKDGRPVTVAVLLFLGYSLVQTARRVGQEESWNWNLAFVVLGYTDLTALFWCVRRAERLVMPAWSSLAAREERRRLQAAVWVLSTILTCAFAYRVSLDMAADLVVVVWCMTSSVVLLGFYVLVVCNDEVCRDFARSGLALDNTQPADEFV